MTAPEQGVTENKTDLWLACLLQLCRHHTLVRHPSQILAGLPLAQGRLNAALIERAARQAGLDCGLVSLRNAGPEALPALACDAQGQPVLLLALTGDTARIARPETDFSESEIALAALHPDIWWLSPLQITDIRSEEFVPTTPRHWLYAAIAQARPWYRDILIATVALNVLALLVPLYTMNVYDRVVPNQAFESLWTLSLGVLIAVLFDWALRSARATLSDTAGRRIDVQLSATLLNRVLGMRLENRPQSVGAFARQIQDFDSVREFLSSATVTVLIDLPFLLLFLALIAWLGGPMVLLPLLALVLLGGYALLRQRAMKAALDEASKLGAQRQALLMESLLLIGDVKQHNLEGRTQRRWEHAVAAQADHNIRVRHESNALAHAVANSQTLITVALIVTGVYRMVDGALSMGGLIAIVMLAGRATATISQSVMLLLRYQQMRTALTGLDAVMAMPQENHSGVHLQREALRGEVRLRNVSFSYPQSKRAALQDLSLTIKPGERVGLIGVAGAGKSTLLALLSGQLRPSEGDMQYDGIGATLWPAAALREQSGWLAQQPSLFFGSLLDNILLERRGVTDVQLRTVLQRAGIDRFLSQLEQGLETAVGELGRQLSGGQRQAVALARALLAEPRLLLLDEPTSAMDREAELQVQEALRQWPRDGVMVLATHRMELLSLCDRLVVLEGGRIIRDGNSAEILASLRPSDSQRVTRIHLQTGPAK